MRKQKSVVAILLAVMMIFTFMPTMAFADEPTVDVYGPDAAVSGTVKWSENFNSATLGDKTEATYSREFSDGLFVIATAGNDKVTGLTSGLWRAYDYYYDLSKATIDGNATWTSDFYTSNVDAKTGKLNPTAAAELKLMMHKPDNATYATGATAADDAQFDGTVYGWANPPYEIVYTATGYDATKPYEPQTITVTAVVKVKSGITGENLTYLNNHLIGEVTAEKKITVKAKEAKATDFRFYIDTVSADAKTAGQSGFGFTYDGKTHTIVSNEVPGFTVSYAVQDEKTQKYVDANPVEMKNRPASGRYSIKYTVTKTSDGTKTVNYFNVPVTAAQWLYFRFDDSVVDATTNDGTAVRKVPADSNPLDFVKVENVLSDADKDEALKYFNDRYEIKVSADKVNPAYAIWTISEKSNVNLAKLKETYKTLFDNYGHGTSINLSSAYQPAKVELVDNSKVATKDDDITFTGVTTKSFKAKKKTKKLAKNKSFQVAATAASGNAVTFTATSSNGKVSIDATGKVTVKKGLKKGAKVKLVVKAHTAAGNGYKAASAEKTYTIKIK